MLLFFVLRFNIIEITAGMVRFSSTDATTAYTCVIVYNFTATHALIQLLIDAELITIFSFQLFHHNNIIMINLKRVPCCTLKTSISLINKI